jgi:hypothetical protein
MPRQWLMAARSISYRSSRRRIWPTTDPVGAFGQRPKQSITIADFSPARLNSPAPTDNAAARS